MLKTLSLHYFWLGIYYPSTIGVWKIQIVIVVFEIPIVKDSDSIGHPFVTQVMQRIFGQREHKLTIIIIWNCYLWIWLKSNYIKYSIKCPNKHIYIYDRCYFHIWLQFMIIFITQLMVLIVWLLSILNPPPNIMSVGWGFV